jgi:hypothetical protein
MNCEDALFSYRMMLSDEQQLQERFDSKSIKYHKETFDAIDLTENERMALFTRFAIWRNKNYGTYAQTFDNPAIYIDEFIWDCIIALANLKSAIEHINDQTVWPRLLAFLKPVEEKSANSSTIPPYITEVLNLLIKTIIKKTPPIYDKITALLKFEEISATKIPVGETTVEEISAESNEKLIEKLTPFRTKEKAALENLLSVLKSIEEMAIESEKETQLNKNKFSNWLNDYCVDGEQKEVSERPKQ